MSKKKVMSISTLSVLLVYFICILVSFISAGFSVDKDFANHVEKLNEKNSVYETAEVLKTNGKPETLFMIKQSFLEQMQFPYCVGYYDLKGNFELCSSSFIEFYLFDKRTKERKVYYKALEDIFDKDNLDYFYETCKEMEANSAGVEKMDYNLIDGKVTPTYLQLSVNGYLMDIKLSDEKAQYHINKFEGSDDYDIRVSADIHVFINPKISFKNKMDYERSLKIKENLKETGRKKSLDRNRLEQEYKDELAMQEEEYTWTFISTQKSKLGFWWGSYRTLVSSDKPYTTVIATERTPFLSIIFSDYFMDLFKVTNYIGAVLMIVVLVLTSIVYDKNKRLEDSRKAFINAAAHELKTPLAVISNNCECALENVSPEKNQEHWECVYNESKRMTKLTQMLINYNKVMQRGSIKKTKADLNSIVQKECEKYRAVFERKNMNVQLNTQPAIIKCNEDLIALAVDNFLSNAAKYGKENKDVILTVTNDKSSVKFSIYNESDPIPDEALPHIWEELYRVDKARNSKDNSTGMGLAINRQIFEIHKFKYDCRNVKNGVEFSFKVQ